MIARYCLLVAVGVVAGVATALLAPRPNSPSPAPRVRVQTGHVEGVGSARALRPVSLRVGDRITRLGPPGRPDSDLALIPMDVDGVQVVVTLAVEQEPVGPPAGGDAAPPPGLNPRADLAPPVVAD